MSYFFRCCECDHLVTTNEYHVMDFRCGRCKRRKEDDVNLLGIKKDKNLDAEGELTQADAVVMTFPMAIRMHAQRHGKTACKNVNTITSRHWWRDLDRESPILHFLACCVFVAIVIPFLAFLGLGALWASIVIFQFWNSMPL